jgi:1-acyl-sn-glycerol-3-phosphate acyltransferase
VTERDLLGRALARFAAGGIWAFTGATARWVGCAPGPRQRIYFGNHTSHGDFLLTWAALPPALRAHTRPVAGADYWLASPLRRFVITRVFHGVLIDRRPEARTEDPIEVLLRALDEGASLIVFPEGTRNTGDTLLPFKSGIYHVARQRPQVELVPAWIHNLHRVMPKGEVLPVPLLCSVTFGAATHLREGETKDACLARLRQALLDTRPA